MAKRLKIKQGDVYGRLTVLSDAPQHVSKGGHKTRAMLCMCACGNKKSVILNSLRSRKTISCGCARKESARKNGLTKKHGARTGSVSPGTKRSYESWRAMNKRCNYNKYEGSHRYKGRGIKICKKWSEFTNFYKDMGDRPKGLTLERVNNNGNYEPTNCKWATAKEQANNRITNK